MSTPTIAFFGATGGCALACLVLALEAGYTCTALARKPEKLQNLLTERGVSADTQKSYLTIIPGDATDVASVRRTLLSITDTTTPPNEAEAKEKPPASIIITGVGGTPTITAKLQATLDNPTICTSSMQTLLTACHTVYPPSSTNAEQKPILATISTTGNTEVKRDYPFLATLLYNWFLAEPHADKRGMEELVRGEMGRVEGERAVRGAVIVRPSLLTDGVAVGLQGVREGSEREPAVGWTVSRRDVGGWLFGRVVEGAGEVVRGGEVRVVSLTY